jgi:hypothetical protein
MGAVQDLLRTSTGYIEIQYTISWNTTPAIRIQYRIYGEPVLYRIYWDAVQDLLGYNAGYIGISG